MVEHQSTESEGLRFDSSWELRIFSLYHACDIMRNIFLKPLEYLPCFRLKAFFNISCIWERGYQASKPSVLNCDPYLSRWRVETNSGNLIRSESRECGHLCTTVIWRAVWVFLIYFFFTKGIPLYPSIRFIFSTQFLYISFGNDKENSFNNQSLLGWRSFSLLSWS